MCGISGVFGPAARHAPIDCMVLAQQHRGPDSSGIHRTGDGLAVLGHNRLSIIDLSDAGHQPMHSADGRYTVVFNGEIYNYLELREALGDYPYRSRSDTEVILAAYEKWGDHCLDRFIGMFALLIWDADERRLFAARDRFGVKPLFYHQATDGSLYAASEIKALHAAGITREMDAETWATFLTFGTSDTGPRTFWSGITALPAGHSLSWSSGQLVTRCWYDLPSRVGDDVDDRPIDTVLAEYLDLVVDSVRLRFRSDVPVAINLSGGLDSSTLLGIVNIVQGADSRTAAWTYITGDHAYDELPWVTRMLDRTRHPSKVCRITPADVPELAVSLQRCADEPFGGLMTIAYARLFEDARATGTIVLLDGQGMDEQWAGYDYYRVATRGESPGLVQGARQSPVRPDCLTPDFRRLAEAPVYPQPFSDALRNAQYRDVRYTKMPKALRFNDRASMRASTELREPFLDHRLFELAFRQPADRKISGDCSKWFLRELARRWLPAAVLEAPKRPVSTPQREWLAGPLRNWVDTCLEQAIEAFGDTWLDPLRVRQAWAAYGRPGLDNSFFLWQWVSLGLLTALTASEPRLDVSVGVASPPCAEVTRARTQRDSLKGVLT
jgi:asparagine synthase (glutamine-hydrolysing)